MNPLKALYLQQRPEDENELHSTPNADDQQCKRNLRWAEHCVRKTWVSCSEVRVLRDLKSVVLHWNLCVFVISDTDQSFNKVAERVLMRLQEKLKGVEEGTVLSVGGQVNLLIQQAMDPKNLSRLFPGWKPWVWTSAYESLLNSAFRNTSRFQPSFLTQSQTRD